MNTLHFEPGSATEVEIPITVRTAGAVVNPTTAVVSTAVVAQGAGEPATTAYVNGSWVTNTTGPQPKYFGRFVVGPLAAGKYRLWLRILIAPTDKRAVVAVIDVS